MVIRSITFRWDPLGDSCCGCCCCIDSTESPLEDRLAVELDDRGDFTDDSVADLERTDLREVGVGVAGT